MPERRSERPAGAWLSVLTLVVAACPSARPAADVDADADADLEADAAPDADRDADQESLDPLCLPGHDPDAPALKLVALSAHLPLALGASGGRLGEMFEGVLASSSVLLAFESLDDEASASLAVGSGEIVGDEEVYDFDPDIEPPTATRVRIDGPSFESEAATVRLTAQPEPLEVPVDMRLRDAVLAGDFATEERCSIGRVQDEGEWQLGGTLVASLTVADARGVRLVFFTEVYTLCQILSGLWEVYGTATTCADVEQRLWPYQPDTTVPDGEGGVEPAWTLDADFAAGAVRMVGHDR